MTPEDVEALRTPAAAELLGQGHRRNGRRRTGPPCAGRTLPRPRAIEPHLVGLALTQGRLRHRAAERLGPRGARLLWTPDTAEQATRSEVAAHRARRLLAFSSVADLGCGAGSDTLAFADAGLRVLAVEHDPTTAAVARANVAAEGYRDLVEVRRADVTTMDVARLGCEAAYVDPARRSGGSRRFTAEGWSPPWSWVVALAERVPATVAKVAPGIPHDLLPAGAEGEWVSWRGDLKEAAVWHGPLRTARRRATLLPSGATVTDAELPPTAAVGPVGGWLVEPDDAVIRAGLVAAVAAQVGGSAAGPGDRVRRLGRGARHAVGDDVPGARRGPLRAQADASGAARQGIRRRHGEEARRGRRPGAAAPTSGARGTRTDRDAGADPDLGGAPRAPRQAPRLASKRAEHTGGLPMAMMGGRFGAVPTGPAPPVSAGVWRRVVVQFRPYRTQVIVVSVLILITSGLGVINPLLIEDVFNEGLFPPGQDGPDMAVLVRLVVIMASITIVDGRHRARSDVPHDQDRPARDARPAVPAVRAPAGDAALLLHHHPDRRDPVAHRQRRRRGPVGRHQHGVHHPRQRRHGDLEPRRDGHRELAADPRAARDVPLFYWLTKIVGDRRRPSSRATQVALADMSAITQETLSVSGVLLSKVFGRQEQEGRRYRTENQRLADLEVRGQMVGQSFFTTVQAFFSLTPVLIYLLAGVLLDRGRVACPPAPSSPSPRCRPGCTSPSVSCCRCRWTCDRRSRCSTGSSRTSTWCRTSWTPRTPGTCPRSAAGCSSPTSTSPTRGRPTTSPNGRAPPVAGVTSTFAPDMLAALVGPSGAGKTTISYLIPRLYDVTGGAVLIDGHDVRDLTERIAVRRPSGS